MLRISALTAALAATPPSLTVLHITDVHIDPHYTLGTIAGSGCYCDSHEACPRMPSSCVHTDDATLQALPFGMPEDSCATPLGLWGAAMAFVAAQSPPSMVFFTGDFGDAGLADACSASSPAKEQIVTNIVNAFAALRLALPGVPIYGAFGNHDSTPFDTFNNTASQAWLYDATAPSFTADFAADAAAAASFQAGGWYATSGPLPGLTIVSLNINYWVNLNPAVDALSGDPGALALGEAQFAFLDATLASVNATGGRAFILGHEPPQGAWLTGLYSRYRAIVSQFPACTVAASFWGHSHVDQFSVVRSCTAVPANSSAPAQWHNITGIEWCSGGNLHVGDVWGLGLEGGDNWCPFVPAAGLGGSSPVELCEGVCGPIAACAGFTYYPSDGPNPACCFRTDISQQPLNASSTAFCVAKDVPGTCNASVPQVPLHVAYVAPSLTEGYPASNPGLRTYSVDATSLDVLDSVTMWGNITAANAAWAFVFNRRYSAVQQYGLPDMSAVSWEGAVAAMALPASRTWDAFWLSMRKGYDGPSATSCVSGACKDSLLGFLNGSAVD
jgi:hypothetical protein